jgi:hypothetical protein
MNRAPEYLPTPAIARVTGMSIRTIRRWIAHPPLDQGRRCEARCQSGPRSGAFSVRRRGRRTR